MSQPYSGLPGQQLPDPQQPLGNQAPTSTKRPVRRIIVFCLAGGALFVAGGFTTAIAGIGDADTDSTTAKSAPAAIATTAPAAAETSEAPPEPTYTAPAKADFKLTAKILGKKCFGSAGCNLTYRIAVAYSGPTLDPAVTYEIVYVVQGGDDGPVTNTLKITGDQSSVDEEEMISTKNKATKLTVLVSDVLAN